MFHVSEFLIDASPDVSPNRGQDQSSKINSDAAMAPKEEVVRETSTPPSAPGMCLEHQRLRPTFSLWLWSVPEPASSPSMWETFVLRRHKLLQEAITDSVRTGTFHNVEIYAYSTRERISRSVRILTVIHARTAFLEASSPILQSIVISLEIV